MSTRIERIKLKAQASLGDPEALFHLGNDYLYGVGVEPDLNLSHKYLVKATEKGFTPARDLLEHAFADNGRSAQLSEELKDLYEDVCSIFRDADNGDPAALYLKNEGRLSDDTDDYMFNRAVSQMKLAADQDYAPALYALGVVYFRGNRVAGKTEEGLEMLKRAFDKGVKEVAFILGSIFRDGLYGEIRDVEKAVACYEVGIENGDTDCMNSLGYILETSDEYPRDHKRAFELYKRAADLGDSRGYNNLGACYSNGLGTERDLEMAFNSYKIAAEHGHAKSQYDLGICYRLGEGTEQNFEKAIEWYLKAIAQGHAGAMCNLGIMYQSGIGVEVDIDKARTYFSMSAEAGNMQGQFCLASLYFTGKGMEQNYEEAVKWFRAAAEQGEPDSMFHLAICYNEGYGVEKDFKMVKAYLFKAADLGWQPAIDAIKANNLAVDY